MLSRIFWIGLAGIAMIAGIALQDGNRLLSWGDHDEISTSTHQAIEQRIDQAIDRSFDKMQVTDSEGQEIEVPAQTKRALAAAVSELVRAETDLAMVRIRDGSNEEERAAEDRRDRAKTEVDRLKSEIESLEQSAQNDNDALREQIRQEVRDEVRATVRDAVKN